MHFFDRHLILFFFKVTYIKVFLITFKVSTFIDIIYYYIVLDNI